MCQFIESICCIDGDALNLHLHQDRINRAFLFHFQKKPFALSQVLTDIPSHGKFKCRIIYDSEKTIIEYQPYIKRDIKSLQLIEADDFDYSYKFYNRIALERLFEKRGNADDIIIIRQGLITDSYYANLAFYDGDKWYTPTLPLLKGTKREQYLQDNILVEKDILPVDIYQYKKVSLINAMLNLSEVEIDISSIYL